ncbi:hypothetical protein XELAEV_18036963mg [Xenopus laevis]|uniref:Uncharacterized protein n=1 Tax=Xenopus laevis TaxID=8355 RepID=A0A974H9R2_XENLA|nr:hypothetical protein XELAEV_18036963mg [Xenopus laevis]
MAQVRITANYTANCQYTKLSTISGIKVRSKVSMLSSVQFIFVPFSSVKLFNNINVMVHLPMILALIVGCGQEC